MPVQEHLHRLNLQGTTDFRVNDQGQHEFRSSISTRSYAPEFPSASVPSIANRPSAGIDIRASINDTDLLGRHGGLYDSRRFGGADAAAAAPSSVQSHPHAPATAPAGGGEALPPAGQMCGIGVRVRSLRGEMSIASVLPGGSAHESGQLGVGDRIVRVDGAEADGRPVQDVAKMFVGARDTRVDLLIVQAGTGQRRLVSLRRKPFDAAAAAACPPPPREAGLPPTTGAGGAGGAGGAVTPRAGPGEIANPLLTALYSKPAAAAAGAPAGGQGSMRGSFKEGGAGGRGPVYLGSATGLGGSFKEGGADGDGGRGPVYPSLGSGTGLGGSFKEGGGTRTR